MREPLPDPLRELRHGAAAQGEVLPGVRSARGGDAGARAVRSCRVAPTDRRTNALHLTPAGEASRRDLERRVRWHEADMVGDLTEKERRQLLALLSRLTP